jgi:sigma-54 specific flagellar transcriptional regulator A|tara:strand:+ start:5571 stop:6713 length:1143 start_codon:yes stop_codon:yes gene_type:complete
LLELNKIIGLSTSIKALRELIRLLGPSDSTVLIVGESGTGKELIANALHGCSGRAEGPFVPVNCGAIPRDLLESELFGHKRGSFTGAISDRKGRFQLADKGTLFLDEIGDMSMDLQVKLLRVLQERTVDPVGSLASIPIDVRVVAATHQNIEALIDEGKFRKDLYYRLNIMPIEVGPLAERVEDIPLLIEHFSKQQAKALQAPISISPASMKLLLAYDWPGNVRELSNLIDRYTALYAQQEVDLRQVPASMVPSGLRKLMQGPQVQNRPWGEDAVPMRAVRNLDYVTADLFDTSATSTAVIDIASRDRSIDEIQRVINLAQGGPDFPEEGVELKQHLLEIEQRLIKGALSKAEGNVSKTARLLSLRRTTLIEKINKYGMH